MSEMTSIRGRMFSWILKRMVAPRLVAAEHSVEKLREVTAELAARQRVPRGVDVEPICGLPAVRGEWLVPKGADDDAVVLYLDGGGLVMGSPSTHRELGAGIAIACDCRVLSVDYRLAPEFPFPSAVADTMKAYEWLLESSIEAGRICIGGDSGGGSLALQSVMAVRDQGLPAPSSLFVMSPQTDWLVFDGASYKSNADRDPWVTESMCRFFASQYVAATEADRQCLSLSTMNLDRLPPILIQVGDKEVLLSDSVRLAELAWQAGVEVQLEVWRDMWHVFQTSARVVPEARNALVGIGAFVTSHFAAGIGATRTEHGGACPEL